MSSIKRVSLVATLALAMVALTAASASADIITPGGSAYVGSVAGVNTGPDPTLETDTTTITCEVATTGGTMDGGAGTGELDFTWDECSVVGGTASCDVDPINDVPVISDESPATAGDFEIINTDIGATFISCALVFNCTASSDPGNGSEVEAYVDGGADPVVNVDDTVDVSGVGCPSEGQWVAEYTVTTPAAGLEATG